MHTMRLSISFPILALLTLCLLPTIVSASNKCDSSILPPTSDKNIKEQSFEGDKVANGKVPAGSHKVSWKHFCSVLTSFSHLERLFICPNSRKKRVRFLVYENMSSVGKAIVERRFFDSHYYYIKSEYIRDAIALSLRQIDMNGWLVCWRPCKQGTQTVTSGTTRR